MGMADRRCGGRRLCGRRLRRGWKRHRVDQYGGADPYANGPELPRGGPLPHRWRGDVDDPAAGGGAASGAGECAACPGPVSGVPARSWGPAVPLRPPTSTATAGPRADSEEDPSSDRLHTEAAPEVEAGGGAAEAALRAAS